MRGFVSASSFNSGLGSNSPDIPVLDASGQPIPWPTVAPTYLDVRVIGTGKDGAGNVRGVGEPFVLPRPVGVANVNGYVGLEPCANSPLIPTGAQVVVTFE
ncbi:MAG: hypothetical protein KGK07_15185 [Chloroflexota bacterium]|nr:hypothetical protein [Chloroflexota bacterium]